MENSFGDIQKVHQYFRERANELHDLASLETPWVFLCCASFIDLLNKMVNNSHKARREKYIEFIENYFGDVDSRYRSFEFRSKEKLSVQMYHVLRSGIVHSFSLFPNEEGKDKGARARSILLGNESKGDKHFQHISHDGWDSVVFTAESFSRDIYSVVEKIFQDTNLYSKILKWCKENPPISLLNI